MADMPTCPHCDTNILRLNTTEASTDYFDGETEHKDVRLLLFWCPECGKVLRVDPTPFFTALGKK